MCGDWVVIGRWSRDGLVSRLEKFRKTQRFRVEQLTKALISRPAERTAEEVEGDHVHGFAAGFGCRGAGSVLPQVIEEIGGHNWMKSSGLDMWWVRTSCSV